MKNYLIGLFVILIIFIIYLMNFSQSSFFTYLKLKNDKKACKNFSLAASLNNFDAINVKKKYCY